MSGQSDPPRAEGLERSCLQPGRDWLRAERLAPGVDLLQAWFGGRPFTRHRHDTYAIGITDSGVQAFGYRGARHYSLPGQVVVLHPDEMHDGRAGSEAGFGYRTLYLEPRLIAEAREALDGRPAPLPFLPQPVVQDAALRAAVDTAFRCRRMPLLTDTLDLELALALRRVAGAGRPGRTALDLPALARAREYLDANVHRAVHSAELEAVTGLSRFGLARQFRLRFGTSPYRYLLMRRLEQTRLQLQRPPEARAALADLALAAGFADQAHFSRLFRAAFGISPGRYAALVRSPMP